MAVRLTTREGSGDAPRILVLNPGSSSLKTSLIQAPDHTLVQGETTWDVDDPARDDQTSSVTDALGEIGVAGTDGSGGGIDAVGYRVVHGGPRFTEPVLVDDDVIDGISSAADMAPLHTTVSLRTIEAGRKLLPSVPHVACFDTTFHATLEPEAYRYPVPAAWFTDLGVRRFGFHGLSVEWAVRRAAELLDRDVSELCLVVAHLGSGSSVTAVEAGRSVETSMGMTTLEGPMMGTRSGSIDPGIPLLLASRGRLDLDAISAQLHDASGLLGVSGRSSDMRALHDAAEAGDEASALAVAMFVRRAAAAIAATATTLPRVDALVFTGGIGEHAAAVRRRVAERLGILGLGRLSGDPVEPAEDGRVDTGGPIAVLRVGAREDVVIAEHVAALVAGFP